MIPPGTETFVRTPITPDMLDALGVLGQPPEQNKDVPSKYMFNSVYRIWTCYGHRNKSNKNVGFLKINPSSLFDGTTIGLNCQQQLLNNQGVLHNISVNSKCHKNDELYEPFQWDISNWFTDKNGTFADNLSTKQTGVLSDGRLTITQNGVPMQREINNRIATDWGLFLATQRFGPNYPYKPPKFQLLENFQRLKGMQTITHRDKTSFDWNGDKLQLDCYQQIGHGVLPFEYYRDQYKRLVLVITGYRCYILDDNADADFVFAVEQARSRGKKR